MKWNPDDFGGIKTFDVRPDDVWLPDIVLYNKSVVILKLEK